MKIMVIGYSGAGKSTLSKILASHYNVPILYLDKVQFKAGWVERDDQEAIEIIEDFLNNNNEWVIDGNYHRRLYEKRAVLADQIIYLNYNRFLCLSRAIKRKNEYKNKVRESMTEGCEEKIDLSFIWWILFDGRRSKYKIKRQQIKQLYSNKFIEFKNPEQLDKYLIENNIQV